MLPSTDEVIGYLEEDLPEEYHQHMMNSANDIGSGVAAVAVYLSDGGRSNIRDAYRIGSLIGVNTRIVDDIMDGDHIEQVEDRERFLNNFIECIEDGEPLEIENSSENAAYTAASLMGEHLDSEIIADYVRDIRDIAIEEDKSTREGYKSYSRGISGTIGEMVAIGLGELDDFEPSTENISFAYDFAYMGQILDDKMDADTGLEEEINEFHAESVERMNRHGKKGKAISRLSEFYPWVYSRMKDLSEVAK